MVDGIHISGFDTQKSCIHVRCGMTGENALAFSKGWVGAYTTSMGRSFIAQHTCGTIFICNVMDRRYAEQ